LREYSIENDGRTSPKYNLRARKYGSQKEEKG
jgi:hypothetical protein